MKNKLTVLLAGALLAAISATAAAHDRFSFGVTIGVPAYTYVPPPPVYYYPPQPVYYYPAPRVNYAPAPWGIRYERGWERHRGYGYRFR